MKLWKNYQLNASVLMKFGVDESKHLLHSKGSVPTIDAELWEANKDKIGRIYIRTTKGRRFKADARVFEREKQVIDFGYGKQYWIDKMLWDISGGTPKTEPKESQNSPKAEPSPTQQQML